MSIQKVLRKNGWAVSGPYYNDDAADELESCAACEPYVLLFRARLGDPLLVILAVRGTNTRRLVDSNDWQETVCSLAQDLITICGLSIEDYQVTRLYAQKFQIDFADQMLNSEVET